MSDQSDKIEHTVGTYPVVDLTGDVDPDVLAAAVEKELDRRNQPKDAFSPEAAPGLTLMMQFRIYDALMGLLEATNPTLAQNIYNAHSQGHSVGFSPAFSGVFIADAIREDVESKTTAATSGEIVVEESLNPIGSDDEPLPHDSVSDKGLES